nr:LPD38 domain-containing protein [Oceanisphaera litoralis]
MSSRIFDEDANGKLVMGDGAGDIDVWAAKFAHGIGTFIPTVGAGGLANMGTKAAGIVYQSMLKRGASDAVARATAQKTVEKLASSAGTGAAVGMGAAGAVGLGGRDVAEQVNGMSYEQLMESETYRQKLVALRDNPEWADRTSGERLEEARRLTGEEAAGAVMTDAGSWAFAAGAAILGDRYLYKMLAGKAATGGMAAGAGKGVIAEGTTEFVQEGGQQWRNNEILNEVAAANIDPMRGVLSGALEGGVIGAGTGGAIGALGGMRKQQGDTDVNPELSGEQIPPAPDAAPQGEVDPGVSPTEITINQSVSEQGNTAPQVVPSDDSRVGKRFTLAGGDDYQIVEHLDGTRYRVANLATGDQVTIDATQFSGKLDIDRLISEYGQSSVTEGDATRTNGNPAGPSAAQFDETRDVPRYLRQDAELDGRHARPHWSDDEAQQALREGQNAPSPADLVRQQMEQGPVSESEPEQQTGDIETWQPNWRAGRQERGDGPAREVEGELVPRMEREQVGEGSRLEGPVIDGEARERGTELPHRDVIYGADGRPQQQRQQQQEQRKRNLGNQPPELGYNDTINLSGAPGDGRNSNYAPPRLSWDQQDDSVEPQSMRDGRTGVGKAIKEAGSEADAIWQQLSTLRVTKRGKPFASEKEAALASRKDEQPVKLPDGYGIARQDEVAEVQAQSAPATEQGATAEAEPAPQNKLAGSITEVPVAELQLSDDVPQFKDGANKDGVVEPLGGSFDRTGVSPIQVWQRKDGRLEVISGRHRLDLARRSGEKTIPAQVHREADGFDQASAATLDAELNIRDNQGKVKDYVQYFQATGIDRAEADRRGHTARALGRRAHQIATGGSEETIAAHRADILSDEAAERITQTAPNDARLQAVGIKAIQEGKSITHATNMMQAVKALTGGQQGDGMGDMFGFDESGMREAEQMAKLAAKKQREISELLRPQKAVANAGALAEQEGITDNLNPEQRKQRMDNLQQLKAAWDTWSTNPELVAELRREIQGEEAPVLSSYTEAELQQQADQVKQAQQDEREAQSRYEADREVGDFNLTGSNAPADVAMSQGQNDMFTQTIGQAEAARPNQGDPKAGAITRSIADSIAGAPSRTLTKRALDEGISGSLAVFKQGMKTSGRNTIYEVHDDNGVVAVGPAYPAFEKGSGAAARKDAEDIRDALDLLVKEGKLKTSKPAEQSTTGQPPVNQTAEPDKPATTSALPSSPEFKDGILVLHGTKVEVNHNGKKKVGSVANKYTAENRANGDPIRISFGFQKNIDVPESAITRIVEPSGWAGDYQKEGGTNPTAEPANETHAPLLYKADGSPFATEKSARISKVFKDNPGATIEVVDGGFAVRKKPVTLKRGEVGGKLGSGEVVLTSTGNRTTPFPDVKLGSNQALNRTIKSAGEWLITNARLEAARRGDEFNGRAFDGMDQGNPTPADKDHAEYYLFDPEFFTQANGGIGRPVSTDTQPSNDARQDDELAAPATEAELKDRDLLKEHAGQWSYRYAVGGSWRKASSKASAMDSARDAYDKAMTGGELPATRAERHQQADDELYRELDGRYGSKSLSELKAERARLDGMAAELRGAGHGEFNGGGRKTGAAVSNEGARQAGSDSLRLSSYIDMRQEKEAGEKKVSAHGVSVTVPSVSRELTDNYNRATHMGKGRDFNAELQAEARAILNELAGRKHTLETDEQRARAAELTNDYLRKKADFHRWDANQAASNPSWMVTGRDGRNMAKANAANDRHMAQYTQRVEQLERQRKAIADQLYRMRPDTVKADQRLNAAMRDLASVVGDIASMIREGKPALEKETRGWASPKAHRLISQAVEQDKARVISQLLGMNTQLRDVGGLVKVLGPRSNAGKLVKELLDAPAGKGKAQDGAATEAVSTELDEIIAKGEARRARAVKDNGADALPTAFDYLTHPEKERRHELIQQLPSAAQERYEASQRVQQRAADRNIRRAVLAMVDDMARQYPDSDFRVAADKFGLLNRVKEATGTTDTVSMLKRAAPRSELEAAFEKAKAAPAPKQWRKVDGRKRVWEANDGTIITDESFTVGGKKTANFFVYQDRHAWDKGNNHASGESLAEAKQKAEQESPRFSKSTGSVAPGVAGLPREQAESVARNIMADWKGAPKLVVVASEAELPAAIADAIAEQNAHGEIEGVHYRGTVYVVADNIHDASGVERVLLHEAVGHYGIARMIGPTWKHEMNRLYLKLGGDPGIEKLAKRFGINLDKYKNNTGKMTTAERNRMMVDELLAHVAQQNLEPTIIDRVVAQIKKWLRDWGLGRFAQYGKADVLRLLEGAKRAVYEGTDGKPLLPDDVKFSRKGDVGGNGPQSGQRTSEGDVSSQFGGERSPWGKNFPEVMLHGKLGDATGHPDYAAAKGGDDAAALRLVRDVLSPEVVRRLRQVVGSRPAIALAVHAEEAVSRNAIPQAMADVLGQALGMEVDVDIVQAAKVGRTGQDGFGRLANQPTFSGRVRADKPYLIMDDTLTQGGTLANLKGYIENRGGKVLAATALTGKQYSAKIAIADDTLQQLRSQYDGTNLETWWQERFGYGFDALTESEARYLIRAKDADKIRDRVTTAGQASPTQGEHGNAEDDGSVSSDGVRFSRNPTTDSALDKLNLGPKPDVIDQAKEKLQALREIDRATATSWLTRVGRKANTELLDALAPIKYIENAIGITGADDSGYHAARLATGSSSTMLGAMLHGLPEWRNGIVQRKQGSTEQDALLGILQPLGKDLHNWLGWMAGHRAEILMAQGRENLLTADEIQALKDLGNGKEQQFNAAKKKWNEFNGAILDLAQEAGLVSAEARAGFESEWYIPFFRETEDGDVLAPFNGKGVANQRSGIKQLKGGANKTNDLLENMFHTTSKMIDAAMKNHAARKTVENLMDTGIIEVIENPNLMDMRAKDKGQEVFSVRHNGEDLYVRTLDKDLFKAMTFLDRKPFDDPFTKVGMAAKRLLTATVTSSPEFMLRNFLRDALSAWTISKDKYNPLDAFSGAVKAYNMTGGGLDMMFAGASFMGGYVNANDPEGMADTIRKGLRRKGMSPEQIAKYEKSLVRNAAQAKGAVADAWAKYNRYGEAAENATREAVYEAALKAGKSKAQAAFEAKDQMDFSMLGASRTLQWFTSVLPFFNARVQGLGKLSREFKDNPTGMAKRGGMIVAGSLALLAINWDNEDYEALPDWDKDMHWHFWLGDQHLRIPKPFEVGVIFGTIPERMARAMGDKDTGAEFGKAVARAVGETFALNPIPQAVNPIVEVYTNYDSFKGRAIESQYEQTLMPEARYDERTSLVMREIGELTGMSPKQLEHVVTGYLGTMGAYSIMAADSLVSLAKDEGDRPASRLWEYPIIKAVYQGDGSTPARSVKQVGQLYDMLDKVTELHNTVNAYRKDNRLEDANQLLAQGGDILRARKSLTRAQRQLRQIRNQMDLIRRDRSLNSEQKRERIDRLMARRNDLAARVVSQNQKWFE